MSVRLYNEGNLWFNFDVVKILPTRNLFSIEQHESMWRILFNQEFVLIEVIAEKKVISIETRNKR